jgi:hypothetical protein
MKFKATSENLEMFVEITNIPTLTFEQVEIAHPLGYDAFIAGNHTWNRLETTTDLTPFYGRVFQMSNDEWDIHNCVVCKGGTQIYFQNAIQKQVK